MNITTYIRKEDEHLWNLIENKSQWIHEQLNKLTPTPAHTPAKPQTKKNLYLNRPLLKIPLENKDTLIYTYKGIRSLSEQAIKDEPRHTCKDNCKHWVWDTNRGGRTNTLTGEFQEGEPW